MEGKKMIAMIIVVLTIPSLSQFLATPVNATPTLSMTTPRPIMQEMTGIPVTENATLNYTVSGNVNFDVYIMTYDNYNRSVDNVSFGYLGDLSIFNVTQAEVRGDIGAGYYMLVVNTTGAGTVAVNDVTVNYPSHGSSIPWDIIVVVIVTAIVASFMTFALMRFRRPVRGP
jgi:hypothetical protein